MLMHMHDNFVSWPVSRGRPNHCSWYLNGLGSALAQLMSIFSQRTPIGHMRICRSAIGKPQNQLLAA